VTVLQRRFKNVLQRIGETFTVAGNDRKGVITIAGRKRAEDFLTDAEFAAATPPLRIAYVPYDDATAESETVAFDGRSYAVLKVVNLRAKGETVARILVMG